WAPGTTAAPVAMGWRLHATTPEDVGDRQPLISTGGALVLVADARIDNHDELARTLDLPRAADGALPDASFILAAYRRWGEDCVERLIGEFAFILWDATRALLIAARDHLGRRCLAYHNDGRKLALASTAAAVAALARIP